MKSAINNAQYNYLSAIAKVQGCEVEDLLEHGQVVESYIDSNLFSISKKSYDRKRYGELLDVLVATKTAVEGS